MKRTLSRLSIPLKQPFATAGGVVAARDLLLLRLEDEDGARGYGEAAPLESYDGVSIGRVAAALGSGPGAEGPPHAEAAEEMARLDLENSRAGRAVGEPGAEVIPVNMTLPGGPPEEVARRAADGLRAGYQCFKLKVGMPDDVDRVAAVRGAIGSWPALRVDANGAWSVEEAVDVLTALAPLDLELVEQPCRTLQELALVRQELDIPVAADEAVTTAEDVRDAAAAGACDAVNVKLAASGGFAAARRALRAASEEGLDAYLSSTLDGPWGIAAALQLAASERVSLACGLATLELFDAELARALPPPHAGVMAVPEGPGLGVRVSDEVLAEVLVEEVEQ